MGKTIAIPKHLMEAKICNKDNCKIIKELEEALKSHRNIKIKAHYKEYYVEVEEVLNYIQKLKEKYKL